MMLYSNAHENTGADKAAKMELGSIQYHWTSLVNVIPNNIMRY